MIMQLTKIFTEFRFEQSFLFDDGRVRSNLVKEIKKSFDNFQFNEVDKSLFFYKLATKTRCTIFGDRIVIDIDNPTEMNKLKSVVSSVVPYILRQLEVTETSRIGVRAFFVESTNKNDLSASLENIINRFFGEDLQGFIRSHETKMTDVQPRIGFSIGLTYEISLNVSINFQQMVSGMTEQNNDLQTLKIEEAIPIFDLDAYTAVSKKPDQINGVVKASCDYLTTYAEKLLSLSKKG